MIPLRDHNPSRTMPIVTYIILSTNVLVFVYMLGLPEVALDRFISAYALHPSSVVRGEYIYTLITSIFLHGGFGHIISNMLFLHIFGDNLEDTLGHAKYALYYVACGLGASFLQIATDPNSTIPNLGASGAIAGLMGGYLLLFPHHKVDVLIPFGFMYNRFTVPAFMMLFYWFIGQAISGIGSLGLAIGGGIAYFAHIGGFIAGVALVAPFRKFLVQKYTSLNWEA